MKLVAGFLVCFTVLAVACDANVAGKIAPGCRVIVTGTNKHIHAPAIEGHICYFATLIISNRHVNQRANSVVQITAVPSNL